MNIFEQLASQNEDNEWMDVAPKSTPEESEFSSLSTDNVSSGNIFETMAAQQKQREENKFSFLDYAKDIAQQVPKKLIAGATGAYGNLLDTFGLQLPEGKLTPGQETIYGIQSDILEKMNRGEPLSFGDFMLLSDEDVVPQFNRLPTSKEVEKAIEHVTGVGEGKTAPGRIAGNAAGFVGEGIPTGGGLKPLAVLGASGLIGQGIREAGAPEAISKAVEIGGSLGSSLLTKNLSPLTKVGKDTVEAGRKLGLTEKQIAPLMQSERKINTVSPFVRKGENTKKLFGEIKDKLGDSYNRIKGLPEAKVKLPNADQINLRKEFGNIRNELSKTLAPSPDKQAALDYIEKSLGNLRNINVTPEHLINFWQDINKSVNWNSITGGKKALARLKEPVSKSLEKAAPNLAKDFELTNDLYSKYSKISQKLKPSLVDSFVNKGEILAVGPSALALINGNPWAFGSLGSEIAIRTLAREMLTNPYFQTIAGKLVNNFNSGSVKAIDSTVKQVQDFMSRKHPNEDWSFLTSEPVD